MKTLTAAALAASTKQYASEPILVVKVEWATGLRYYAPKVFFLNPITTEGRLVSVTGLSWTKKKWNVGSVGSLSFTLEDTDGFLKTIYDTAQIENTKVSVYQHWIGNAFSDLLLLFQGNVVGPISWSEGQRLVTFDAESKVQDRMMGFEPPPNKYLTDAAWPISFGNVVHSPALAITKHPTTQLRDMFTRGQNEFVVLDSGQFALNTTLNVQIGGFIFRGQFKSAGPDAPNRFYVEEANIPKWENVALDARPDPTVDPEAQNPAIAYLKDFRPINDNYILVQDEFQTQQIFRVVKQEGKKISLDSIYKKGSGAVAFLDDTFKILQVAKHGREGWALRFASGSVIAQSGALTSIFFRLMPGEAVTQWDTTVPDVYILNLIPNATVVAVWSEKDGAFRQVPSIYYTKQPTYSIEGMTLTALTFPYPVAESGWSTNVWVTMRSTVGPNVSDVLKYMVDTWSNLTSDAGSFATLSGLVAKYPVGFTIAAKVNTIKTCEDVAWQARVGLIIEDGKVKVKYLSTEPTSDATVTEDTLKYKSVKLGATRTEDILTRLKSRWKPDGHTFDRFVVYENNVSTFGLLENTFDFYIYNIQSLVQKSTTFWGSRLSRSWKTFQGTAPMDLIGVDMFDCVSVGTDASLLGSSPVKSVVQRHELKEDELELELWLPLLSGTSTQAVDAWMSDAADVTPVDPTLAFHETADDFRTGNPETNAYGGASQNDTAPAIVVSDVRNTGFFGDFLCDIYRNGYPEFKDPKHPTASEIAAALIKATDLNVPVYLLNPKGKVPAWSTLVSDPFSDQLWRQRGDRVTVIFRDREITNPFAGPGVPPQIRMLGFNKYIDNGNNPIVDTMPATVAQTSPGLTLNMQGLGTDQPPTVPVTIPAKVLDPNAPAPQVGDIGVAVKSQDQVTFVPSPSPLNVNCSYVSNADQAYSNQSDTPILYQTKRFDNGNLQTAADTFTVQRAGRYFVAVIISRSNNTTHGVEVRIDVYNADNSLNRAYFVYNDSLGGDIRTCGHALIDMTVGQKVKVNFRCTTSNGTFHGGENQFDMFLVVAS